MIFLLLWVTADAGGGLKGPAQLRRSLRGFGGVSHQQASAGIYRRIACRYYRTRPRYYRTRPSSLHLNKFPAPGHQIPE